MSCGEVKLLRPVVRAAAWAVLLVVSGAVCVAGLEAQSISMTNPGSGTPTITGSANTFTVSLTAAPTVVKVCYTLDVYPLFNPGIDAPTVLGCSLAPPFSIQYNSYWNGNGPHTLIATAYNALGAVVATSAAVPFTIQNTWPNPNNLTMTVSYGTAVSSPWSGAVAVTPSFSGTGAGTDSLTYDLFVNGILQGTTTSTAPAAISAQTTNFQNGPAYVCVQVTDNTSGTTYNFDGTNELFGGEFESCVSVTLSNATTATNIARTNAEDIYLVPGGPSGGDCSTAAPGSGSCTATAKILNTDGTLTSGTPTWCAATGGTPPAGGTYPGNLWCVTASTTGTVPFSVNSSTGVVTAAAGAFGSGYLLVEVPSLSGTDLAANNVTPTQVTSASHPFTANEVGEALSVTGGSGWTPGMFYIGAVNSGKASIDCGIHNACPSATSATGGSFTVGPARLANVMVAPTDNTPCFGANGAVYTSYNSACQPMHSMFGSNGANSLMALTNDQPYSPGPAADFNMLGITSFEVAAQNVAITGLETSSGFSSWDSSLQSYVSGNEATCQAMPNCTLFLLGGPWFGPDTSFWGSTYGPAASWSTPPAQDIISRWSSYGNVFGMNYVDEVPWGANPLQGPIVFSSGAGQSWLESVTASGGACSARVGPGAAGSGGAAGMSLTAADTFIIHGSAESAFNMSEPNVFSMLSGTASLATATATAVFGGGATATAVGSGSTVTVTMTSQGSGYTSGTPVVTLTGGGGTYTSATPTISGGAITAITVAGASGYTGNPTVSITQPVTATITNGGSGYGAAPSVALIGGGGTYTAASATVSGGAVTGITVTGASGYTSNPTVEIYSWYPSPGSQASAVAAASGSTVTITMLGGGNGYSSTNPPNVGLIGGGGTYTSATPAISGGAITGITVTGASGYTSNPQVIFIPNFTFACAGVPNGTYNSSNDSGFTLEPLTTSWVEDATSAWHYTPNDVYARLYTQANAVPAPRVQIGAAPAGYYIGAGSQAFTYWFGNSLNSTQSLGGVTQVAEFADLYPEVGGNSYLISRPNANDLLAFGNIDSTIVDTYGQGYDPAKPLDVLTTGTDGNYWGRQGGPGVSVVSCVGHTITFSAPHGITNFIPGMSEMTISGATDSGSPQDTCNQGFFIWAAPTPTTLTVTLAKTDQAIGNPSPIQGGPAGVSGTMTFQDGSTYTLNSGSFLGFWISGQVAGPCWTIGWPNAGSMCGDQIGFPSSSPAPPINKRGQTFTFNGTATGAGASFLNSNTFLLDPENVAQVNTSNATWTMGYRQVPVLNATGGTAYILTDNNNVRGPRNASALAFYPSSNPYWYYATSIDCMYRRCAAERQYTWSTAESGYDQQKLGFTGFGISGALKTLPSPTNPVNVQLSENQHFENTGIVPGMHAKGSAALQWNRYKKYWFQPRLNSPDYGPGMLCAAAGGSPGNILSCMNVTDGPQTITFNLSPYLQSGQQMIEYVGNDHSISGDTILSAGTSSATVTLQPGDTPTFVFPANFATEVDQPSIAARLADVASATDIVVRWAYDTYYLDSAGNNYDCGNASPCTPSWDRNVGTIYYRILYRNSSGAVIARSDVLQL